MRTILKIYDYLRGHTKFLWLSLVATLVLLASLVATLDYSENINDFLPLNTREQKAIEVYQNISGADRLFILFSNPDDADMTVEAIDYFVEQVAMHDTEGWCSNLTVQMDMNSVRQLTEFVYDNIPYFLTDSDYQRMEAMLDEPEYIDEQLQRNLEMLMFPTGGMMTHNISRDPLALFTPVLAKLQSANQQMVFEMYDGYIFTPDMSRAVAMLDSPFGGSETENNAKLLTIINESIEQMEVAYPDIDAHVVGGPEIAVGNASRIKTDSMMAIALSVVLIVLLAAYAIRSFRNIVLIFISVGWGWLFAMGGISLFNSEVSIIVIGISSVILGIAVNYPLHLIVHLSHERDIKRTIRQIMLPLVIGNITTVGAFLTLTPLQSVALRDLGLFASLLLVGTILFVLVYMPHMVTTSSRVSTESKLIDRIAAISPERSRVVVAVVVVATLVFAIYSQNTEFDSNLANCNYMTEQQREDMRYFNDLLSQSSNHESSKVYVLASGATFDEALQQNSALVPAVDSLVRGGVVNSYAGVSQFLVSKAEQTERLKRWDEFTTKYRSVFTGDLSAKAVEHGFSAMAFTPFMELINDTSVRSAQDIESFRTLTDLVLAQNVTRTDSDGMCHIVNVLDVANNNVEYVKAQFDTSFDVVGMNSALSNNLSDNFNYIGVACSVIVFLFLWFSFGRLELAIISFLPMVISWIWILGLMALIGIKFNIVNIILATFIFGQGDDYTIFITEGCQSEYTYRRKVLSSYKSSILQSALIMFVGIGTLIISQHPAMRSLAEVTIVGMLCVVLMAYMIPPLLFRWLTTKEGEYRKHPITIKTLLLGYPTNPVSQVRGRYIYKGASIMRSVNANLRGFSTMIVNDNARYEFYDRGYGEQAILIALTHPDIVVVAHVEDDERRRVAEIAAKDFVNNIEFIE